TTRGKPAIFKGNERLIKAADRVYVRTVTPVLKPRPCIMGIKAHFQAKARWHVALPVRVALISLFGIAFAPQAGLASPVDALNKPGTSAAPYAIKAFPFIHQGTHVEGGSFNPSL